MGLLDCSCCNQICIMVLLKLWVLLFKSDVLLLKILHLMRVSLLQGIHLSFHGDDQQVIIKLLTRELATFVGFPFSGPSMPGIPSMVDSYSHGHFPWSALLVSSSFIVIVYVVVEGKFFVWPHNGCQMFLPNLAKPPHGDSYSWAPPWTMVGSSYEDTSTLKLVAERYGRYLKVGWIRVGLTEPWEPLLERWNSMINLSFPHKIM